MIEHEQEGAFDIHIAGPLDLETIRLLSGGHPVPLEEQVGTEQHRGFDYSLTFSSASSALTD